MWSCNKDCQRSKVCSSYQSFPSPSFFLPFPFLIQSFLSSYYITLPHPALSIEPDISKHFVIFVLASSLSSWCQFLLHFFPGSFQFGLNLYHYGLFFQKLSQFFLRIIEFLAGRWLDRRLARRPSILQCHHNSSVRMSDNSFGRYFSDAPGRWLV